MILPDPTDDGDPEERDAGEVCLRVNIEMRDTRSVSESTSRITKDFEDHADAEDYERFRGLRVTKI